MRHRFPQDRSANTRRKETSVTTRGNVERPRRSRKMMRAKALGERIGFNLSAVEQSSISDIYEARLDTIQAGSGTTFHRLPLSLSRWAWCIISVFFICRQLALPPLVGSPCYFSLSTPGARLPFANKGNEIPSLRGLSALRSRAAHSDTGWSRDIIKIARDPRDSSLSSAERILRVEFSG